MTIHKLKKHQDDIPYAMLSRDVIQTIINPVSLAIWTYLQSLPDNWDLSEKQIRKQFSIGKTRYMDSMRLLRELGLYEVIHAKNEKNQFIGNYYHVYASPKVRKPILPETVLTEKHTYIKEKTLLNRTIKDKEKKTSVRKPDDTAEKRNQIISYLNLKTGARFKPNSKVTKKHISARLNAGHTIEDFMLVIDSKSTEWTGDPQMQKFLRPATLFGSKFDDYLATSHIAQPEPQRTGAQILMDNIGQSYERTDSNINNRLSAIGDQHDLGKHAVSASAGQVACYSAPVDENTDPFYS